MKQVKDDYMIVSGLKQDIVEEEKRARITLSVDKVGNNDNIKHILMQRIKRKKYIYSMYADFFLQYINSIIYQTFDVPELIIKFDADKIEDVTT